MKSGTANSSSSQHTFRFDSQVGLSPLFSLSMSSFRSDVPWKAKAKVVSDVWLESLIGSSGVSNTGPSHSSVRMLSSDNFLPMGIPSIGVVGRGGLAGWVGGGPGVAPSSSSWKIGMITSFPDTRSYSCKHSERIEGLAEQSRR